MGFYDAIRVGASGAVDSAFTVDRSLRFDHGSSTDLSRTPSSTGNRKVWTFSAWIKLGHTDAGPNYIYSAHSGSDYFGLYFRYNELYSYFSPGNNYGSVSDRKFRDVGAWFHVVHQVDAANTTQRIWINGTELSLNSGRNPANNNYPINQSGVAMKVGSATWRDDNVDSYMAEIHYSDGNKYAASDFAETNSETGQWVPKSPSITYGTNGFYLNFSDNSGTTATTLGKDSSGNGNNFTPNNFSVAAGAGNDSLEDTPTNNFCTLSPLLTDTRSNASFSNGNLTVTTGSGASTIGTTFPQTTGKWYAEFVCTAKSSVNMMISVNSVEGFDGERQGNESQNGGVGFSYVNNGNRGDGSSYGASWAIDDVMGIALDLDNNTVNFYKNNSAQGTISITDGYNYVMTLGGGQGGTTQTFDVNFGQRAFTYTPPTGFKKLNSANLPDPTILLPNKHFDTLLWTGTSASHTLTGLNFQPDWFWAKARSQAYHHTLMDSVRGSDRQLWSNRTDGEQTNANFLTSFNSNGVTLGDNSSGTGATNTNGHTYVGWNWNAGDTDGKTYTVTVVDDSGNKYRFDGFGTSAVTLDLAEGGTYIFNYPSAHPLKFSTTSDGTHGGGSEYTTGVTHNSSTQVTIVVAASAPTLYYYCGSHSGMGGQVNTNSTLGSSNFGGSIQSTVKANASAGFSITGYKGNNSAGATIGHGLGVAPSVLIVKNRDSSRGWMVYHHKNTSAPATEYLWLDQNSATADYDGSWNDTAPTSTVFSIGNSNETNENNSDHIAYCFSEVAGYSKFGSYAPNGYADGNFIYLGFAPSFFLIKNTHTTRDWIIFDNKRNTSNERTINLKPNSSGADTTDSNLKLDFLSNGVKLRGVGGSMNTGDGVNYIYLAFAEAPFKNARAR